LSYGYDQDQGPAENYVAFKTVFKQHYGIGGATNNLCWADTFRQRSEEDIREYFSRATEELGNHLKESAPLLYGNTYMPVDISGNLKVTLARLRTRQERGLDLDVAFLRDKLESCSRYVTAQATKEAKFELARYRRNYQIFLPSQAIMQGISKDVARSYAAEQVEKRGKTLYTDRKMMLLLMDKIIEFDRTDKTRRNATIAVTTVTQDDPAMIEAVKFNKKKGKGKGKGKGKDNVVDTNIAATFVATTQKPSTKQCKFCNKAGHIESEFYTKQNLEKFRHKMASAVAV
jgi:hypothetical protein